MAANDAAMFDWKSRIEACRAGANRVRGLVGLGRDSDEASAELVAIQFRAARSGYPVTFVGTMIATVITVCALPANAITLTCGLPLLLVSMLNRKRPVFPALLTR